MKRAVSILFCLLFALTLLYPCGFGVALCFGYTFELFSVPAFSAALAALSALLLALMLIGGEAPESGAVRVLSAMLAPFSMLNAGLSVFSETSALVIVCILFSAGVCFFLTIRCGKPFALKTVSLIPAVILILPLCFLCFISLIFGGISENTVVRTLYSPSGRYCAQIIDSDQGALGGNTFVDVHERGFDALLFRLEKQPRRVYDGGYGAYKDMEIEWKDDEVLMIDSAEYPIE